MQFANAAAIVCLGHNMLLQVILQNYSNNLNYKCNAPQIPALCTAALQIRAYLCSKQASCQALLKQAQAKRVPETQHASLQLAYPELQSQYRPPFQVLHKCLSLPEEC